MALVVLYHFWPMHLTGGFVGVDVFFVISGYLITGHLFREAVRDGRVRLGRFWGRRIRRLLPLSFVVLLVTSLAALAFLPSPAWQQTFRHVIGSAFYIENWLLAGDAVDYSAMQESATAVQHFWSLSVEEQFYVLWPLMLMPVVWAVFRTGTGSAERLRRLMITLLSVLALASLAFSVAFTAYDPAQAYFATPTRVWEFAAGALVALLCQGKQYTGGLANLIGWAGVGAIVAVAVIYSDATAFPGYTALLPVLGTAAVLLCGGFRPGVGVYWWLARRPATFGGDISYAVYLWHWPVVVISPFVAAAAETWQVKILLIGGIVVVSWLSKLAVEDPCRRSRFIAPLPRTYLTAATGMALVAVVALVSPGIVTTLKYGESVSASSNCYGYRSLEAAGECDPIEGEAAPNPSVEVIAAQRENRTYEDCQAGMGQEEVTECRFGVDPEAAETTWALVGDSHATAWLPALDAIAAERQVSLRVYTRGGCTPNVAERVTETTGRDLEVVRTCDESNREVTERLADSDEIDAVLVAASQIDRDYVNAEGQDFANPTVEGMTAMWSEWTASGKDVVVFGEVPRLEQGETDVPTCVAEHADDVAACGLSEEKAFPWNDNLRQAAEGFEDGRFHFLETKDLFCREGMCHAVIGGVVTYYDGSHVSETYARELAPELAERFESFGLFQRG